MANPQPVPFVRFSKELFEAFYLNPPATVAACRLWLWVLRWTWADFGKEETKGRSLAQIAGEVGLSKPSVCRELSALVRCRRLKIGKDGGYAIQKDYDLWRDDTRKRKAHFGNTAKQVPLFMADEPFHTVKSTVSPCDNKSDHRVKLIVSPCEPPIRSKNTVENREKSRKRDDPQALPNGKNDTPRNRAELGHPEFAPEDHQAYDRLGFKLKDELAAQWRDVRKATACVKGCGRQRASDAWPFCRPCTVCHVCKMPADGGRKFQKGQGGIICTECADKIK